MKISLIGASGFIGQHLIQALLNSESQKISVLSHQSAIAPHEKINVVKGSLFDTASLNQLIDQDDTVVNLAYLSNSTPEENIKAVRNIAETCLQNKAKRLVHLSTAIIVGRSSENCIDEDTKCLTHNEYERTKLLIEEELKKVLLCSNTELIILRPTAVLGIGGQNLVKIVRDHISKNRFVNYLKSCLYGKRKMNLVSVNDVISAIQFTFNLKLKSSQETFIISDDGVEINNYYDIERLVLRKLKIKDYFLPVARLPFFILSFILRMAGQSNLNPKRVYSREKLEKRGWTSDVNLEEEISDFIDHQKVKVNS
tara:strand:- start:122283 stop:123218 length:936 start_codon:yes stop_codon:yes gene_type:complete